jgi:hypothetical protein
MNKKISTVMVFQKSADGNIKQISIETAGGMDNVIKQIKTGMSIPINTANDKKAINIANGKNAKANGKNAKANGKKAINAANGKKAKTDGKKTNIIRFNRLQFIFTYMTDDVLIDFLMGTDNDFIIYFSNGRQIDIEVIEIYRTVQCDCDHCRKVVINEDPDILDKMDNKSYIEIKLDDDILNIIAEKQFKILEIMANIIVPLPSSIPAYPTFLPPIVALPPITIDLTD